MNELPKNVFRESKIFISVQDPLQRSFPGENKQHFTRCIKSTVHKQLAHSRDSLNWLLRVEWSAIDRQNDL